MHAVLPAFPYRMQCEECVTLVFVFFNKFSLSFSCNGFLYFVTLAKKYKPKKTGMKSRVKHMSAFSVIMPTYNQAAFIRRAIVSLRKQTCATWELIIVNDGSTDNTEDFLESYLDDVRIKYIHNEVNRGLGYALN